MKQRLLRIVILVAALAGWSCDSNPFSPGDQAGNSNSIASETFSFEKNAAGHTGLRLEGINGGITITGSAEASSVVISGENIDVRGVHGSVSVDLINGAIGARLSLPAGATVDMATVNGVVQLDIPETTSAQLTADVVNGAITLSNLDLHNSVSTRTSLRGTLGEGRGRVSLRTTNGNIGVAGF